MFTSSSTGATSAPRSAGMVLDDEHGEHAGSRTDILRLGGTGTVLGDLDGVSVCFGRRKMEAPGVEFGADLTIPRP